MNFIQEVVEGVLKSYGFDHIRPDYDIFSVLMAADKAVRIGLIINELSTNSCKYAFPFSTKPAFTVQCQWQQNKLRLVVFDNGPGLPAAHLKNDTLFQEQKTSSFGLSLIQTQVVQLNGASQFNTITNDAGNNGTKFTLEFRA